MPVLEQSLTLKHFSKSPTSFQEQVNILKRRGLIISDEKAAIEFLSHFGYYRLEAYALNFQSDKKLHLFKIGTYFEEIIGLYRFDRELRLLLLDAIESFEISFRTSFANYLSCQYNTPFPHLKKELFISKRKNRNFYDDSIKLLKEQYQKSKEIFIAHFKNTYCEELPPIWMVTELMTLGELSKWFLCLANRNDQIAIASKYGLRHDTFIAFLNILTNIRNFSAHHARLWNRKMSVEIKLKNLPDEIKANINETNNLNIYNPLVFLIFCLRKINSSTRIASKLRRLIGHYNIQIEEMGFPLNWKDLSFWKINEEVRLTIQLSKDTFRSYKRKGEDWKFYIQRDLENFRQD